MTPDWKRIWKDVGVFAVCVGVYLALLTVGIGVIVLFIEGLVYPHPILDGWVWVFAFPVCVANQFDPGGPVAWSAILLDPFIYGGSFWLAWRMLRLMRSK